ncbi:hypothetical protein B296_00048532 [Ensete ventricosum]|uniref:Uncharacterized protein n=1 Tax=Ensete ventricosum TaxID=4639 RepID=A0A426Y8T8_ENSVE|nr:hypothetical protein B296_00048532 [Ensete ventricosum]
MRAMTFFLEEVRSQSSTEMGCAASVARAADLVLASRGDGHGKWTSVVNRSIEEGWVWKESNPDDTHEVWRHEQRVVAATATAARKRVQESAPVAESMVMASSQLGGSIKSHPWEVTLTGALGKENRGDVICGVAGAQSTQEEGHRAGGFAYLLTVGRWGSEGAERVASAIRDTLHEVSALQRRRRRGC